MVHAGCVFLAGIHPSRTWMSGSLESVRWNTCVHRLELSLYSHPRVSFSREWNQNPWWLLGEISCYLRIRGGLNTPRGITQDSKPYTLLRDSKPYTIPQDSKHYTLPIELLQPHQTCWWTLGLPGHPGRQRAIKTGSNLILSLQRGLGSEHLLERWWLLFSGMLTAFCRGLHWKCLTVNGE